MLIAGFVCLLALSGCDASAGQTPSRGRAERVLFVGNSFTFYNDGLHTHYGNLLRASGRFDPERARVRMMTLSSATLDEQEPLLSAVLGDEPWDAVVIHGHSRGPIKDDPVAFRASARRCVDVIRAAGAEPVLLMTWAYEGESHMTVPLADAYNTLGRELGVRVLPVGIAFARARRQLPQVDLHKRDLQGIEIVDGSPQQVFKRAVKHPSLAGTYLASCVAYAALAGESPVGVSYHAGLDRETARALQKIGAVAVADGLENQGVQGR